jgi:sulfate permease, SulP family
MSDAAVSPKSDGKAAPQPKGPSLLQQWFPAGVWLPKYKWGSFLVPDLIAAVSVAALLIPESMGYASVAGVPAQIGLYAAPLALVGYALFGGSRLLVFAAAGSVAAISASVVSGLHPHNQGMAIELTAALAIAAGVVFLVGGLVRMGWIANFISKAVMAGFITAMAINIIIGQLGHVTGVKAKPSSPNNTFDVLGSELSKIGHWNWTSTVLGLAAIVLIFAIQRFLKVVPAALTAVILASIYVAALSPNIELVKKIPTGLPSFHVPTGLSGSTWATLILGGCVVALVGFSEGWGSVATIAKKTHDDPNPNQEFRAFGLGMIGSGILGGLPVTGSLSKSSAAMTAGAKSQMANILMAIVVLLTLAALAPLFQWLPEAVLAAVVINAMWGAASPMKIVRLLKDTPADFALGVITGLVVLIFGLLPGMVTGIILSIIYLVYKVSFPPRAELGRDEKTGEYEARIWISSTKKGEGNPDAREVPGVMLYRFDAPLEYSNSDSFKGTGEQIMIDAAAKGPLPKYMIIDFEMVFYIDATGAAAVGDLKRYADLYDVQLLIARMHSATRDVLKQDGVLDEIGEDHVYDNVHDAMTACTSPQQETAGAPS